MQYSDTSNSRLKLLAQICLSVVLLPGAGVKVFLVQCSLLKIQPVKCCNGLDTFGT